MFKSKIGLVLLVLLFTVVLSVYADTAEDWYNQGQDYFSMQDYDHAAAAFTAAIKLNPDYLKAYARRGLCYENSGKYELAIADFTKALKNPQDIESLYQRGVSYQMLRQFTPAAADYERVIRLNPQYVYAYKDLGLIYYEQYRLDLAAANFTKAIELNPQWPLAYWLRGNTYGLSKKYPQAIADFQTAVRLKPGDWQNYFGLAQAEELSGLKTEAAENYKQALNRITEQTWTARYKTKIEARLQNDWDSHKGWI
jgi:tetratricopeptide (TPR) repeat protein